MFQVPSSMLAVGSHERGTAHIGRLRQGLHVAGQGFDDLVDLLPFGRLTVLFQAEHVGVELVERRPRVNASPRNGGSAK